MKLWTLATFCTTFLLILSGCGATPKPENKAKVDATLQTIKLTQAGTFVDMNAIAFEWQSIQDERVQGIHIYKKVVKKEISKEVQKNKLSHYKTIDNRFTTHFVDTKVEPDTAYKYGFKTFRKDAESRLTTTKVINSLPVLESVVWIQSIQNMPRTAKIIWRPHSNQKVKAYIIERKTLQDSKWEKLATVEGRLNAEFIDMELKDNFVYKYRVRVLTYDKILSSPSEIVQVITKALPLSIKNIVATTNLPKKIKITWNKSTAQDFARYYLYRAQKSNGSYKLIAKLHNNTFIDSIDEDGKEFFYRVSAVEKNALESIHDKLSIQGITLNKPRFPSLVEARLIDGKVKIMWKNMDSRAKNFVVVKKSKIGWFDTKEEEFVGIDGNIFVDAEVGPNITYFYRVYAIDEFSIKSDSSIEVELLTPKTLVDNRKIENKQKNNVKKKSSIKVKKVDEEVIIPMQDFN